MSWRQHLSASFSLLLVAMVAGCPSPSLSPSAPAAPAASQPLRLIVIDDPDLGQAIAREWQARTEEVLEVKAFATADLATASRLPGDVIVFPSGLIGQLVERGLIVALDDEPLAEPEFDRRDIFDQIRLREMTWGNRTVAVPLGSPQLLLAYRSDILEQAGLTPPADWANYQKAVEKLADRAALGDLAPPADQPWRATVEPLADGWAGQLLLARAAAYAMHRDQISPLFEFDTADPLIDRPPYTRAMKELVAAGQAAGFADQRFTPEDALNEVRSGRAAMALAWPLPGPKGLAERAETAASSVIRYALLPGSRQSFNFGTKRWETREAADPQHVPTLALSGRLAGVTSNAIAKKRAEGFLIWLAGKEVSGQVGPQSLAATLFRRSQIAEAHKWTGNTSPAEAKQYAETLGAALAIPQVFPGLRLPGRTVYLQALDKAVQQATSGESTPTELLAETKASWMEITAAIGVEKQRQANLRCLGQADLP